MPELPKKEINVKLYTPHSAQLKLHQSPARFRIVAAGRRFGKTLACANECVKVALENPKSHCAWISPVWRQCALGSDAIYPTLKDAGLVAQVRRANGQIATITLKNGSKISFFSATHPETIRGNNFSFAVLDEAAFTPRDVWEAVVRPTLADTLGRAILISTPFGQGYFWELFISGQNPANAGEIESFHFPTSANPYIAAEEIDQYKRTNPEDLFRQEYLAEFLASGAGVFRNVDSCIRGNLIVHGLEGRNYIVGVDFAKQRDYTVIMVLDREERQVVHFDRFSKIDWSIQLARIQSIAKRFNNPKVWVDSTSQGDPLCEQLQKMGLRVTGYNMNSNLAKNALVENLSAEMAQGRVFFPEIHELIAELKMFQYEISDKSKKITYSAPERKHDDTVIALALAIWGCKSKRAFEQFRPLGEQQAGMTVNGEVVFNDYKPLTEEDYKKAQLNWYFDMGAKSPKYRTTNG